MTGNTLLDDLQRQIDAGQVVAIVGAGVSVGATKGSPVASWQGLLHHGVGRCLALSDLTDAGAKLLHDQIDSEDLDMMLAAAEVISRKLGAPGGGEWRIWLRETVGQLRVEQRGVLEALRDLGVTLATTNYDGLIEEVTGLPPVTWRDGAIVERVLRGEEEGVLHLHGFWKDPESVVLGVRDYEKVLGDAHAQTMQRAMRSLKTLLFVGCGEGLADPNFGALLRWSEGVFAGSESRHFRLALDSEVTGLQARHPEEQRICVLGYGADFGDLVGYLRGLRGVQPAYSPPPHDEIRGSAYRGTTTAQRKLRVFLCHALADKPEVRRLYDRLIADGFEVWLDEVNLLPGREWRNEISRAVREADVFLACLTAHSISKTGYVQREIKFALDVAQERPEGTIFIIPVRLQVCEIPESLSRWHGVDLFSHHGYKRLRAALSHRKDEI